MLSNRQLLRAALIVWLLAGLLIVANLLTGCVTAPTTVPAGTPNEVYLLETAHRLASEMGTSVDPRITHEVYLTTCSDGTECPAAGWVPNGGRSHIIYFWSPYVNDPERTYPQLDGLARHEVEHVACQCSLGEK